MGFADTAQQAQSFGVQHLETGGETLGELQAGWAGAVNWASGDWVRGSGLGLEQGRVWLDTGR